MGSIVSLFKYTAISFFRDRGVIFSIIALPVLLLSVAKTSAPTESIPLIIDSTLLITEAETLVLALYSMTSVVLVASVTSFFLAFSQRDVIPRLKIMGYKEREIAVTFIFLTSSINMVAVLMVWLYTRQSIEIQDETGFLVGLILIAVVMSIVGLVISELITSKTLSLYILLSLAMIDAAFIENPAFSRRYNDDWTQLMPANLSLKILLRSVYDTGTLWSDEIYLVFSYIGVLFISYILVRMWRKSK